MLPRQGGVASHHPLRATLYLGRVMLILLLSLLRLWAASSSDVADDATGIIGAIGAVAVIAVVLRLVVRRRLLHVPALSLVVNIVLVVIALIPGRLQALARLLGFVVPANLLFFAGFTLLLMVTVQISVELTGVERRVQRLAEEIALIRNAATTRKSCDDPSPASHDRFTGPPLGHVSPAGVRRLLAIVTASLTGSSLSLLPRARTRPVSWLERPGRSAPTSTRSRPRSSVGPTLRQNFANRPWIGFSPIGQVATAHGGQTPAMARPLLDPQSWGPLVLGSRHTLSHQLIIILSSSAYKGPSRFFGLLDEATPFVGGVSAFGAELSPLAPDNEQRPRPRCCILTIQPQQLACLIATWTMT